jgi:hypothetical protein
VLGSELMADIESRTDSTRKQCSLKPAIVESAVAHRLEDLESVDPERFGGALPEHQRDQVFDELARSHHCRPRCWKLHHIFERVNHAPAEIGGKLAGPWLRW